MFGRSRRVAAAPDTGRQASRFAPVTTVEALPDTPNIARIDRLQGELGHRLQGFSGVAYGYDRGDPTLSLGGPVAGVPQITDAQARIYANTAGNAKPVMNFQDIPGNDPALDPYKALTWSRMVAP